MTDDSRHIDYLIARFLSGEASAEEQATINEWRLLSDENSRYFSHLQEIFVRASTLKPDAQFDVDKAWSKVSPKIRTTRLVSIKPKRRYAWIAAAASVVMLAGIWIGLEYSSTKKQQGKPVEIAAKTMVKETILPDGSKVSIDANSKIAYAEGFGKSNRDITLTGDATFDVKHQGGPAFTVKAGGAIIRDIGTVFRVETRKDTSVVEVYVRLGSVVFYTEDSKGIVLKQGETGIYNKRTKEFRKIDSTPDNKIRAGAFSTHDAKHGEVNGFYLSYLKNSRSFSFQNAKLTDVAAQLSLAYNVPIAVGNSKLGSKTITVEFENEDIDTILSIVAETLDLKVVKRGDGYLLTGE